MIVLFFIFGLIVGSFLNALIHRLHTGESIARGRSHCVHCHHELSAADLVPVFSFIYLRGKCRYCHQRISWQYPIVELLTALSFALAFYQFGLSTSAYWAMLFTSILILIGVFDFLHYLILDKVVYPSLILALIYRLTLHMSWLEGVYGVLVVAGFFALQYYASRGRWIGFGDVKLGLFLGLLFGWQQGLLLLMVAYLLGAIVGVILISLGKKNLGSRLPFGSFLSISAIINILYGTQILHWYLRLLGI